MKRFLITSPSFTGEADILFDEEGRLVKIDFVGTNMNVSQVAAFKAKLPAHITGLEEAFANTKVIIAAADYEVSFADFWKAYDKKVNKKRCEPLWAKLSVVERIKALNGVAGYKKYLTNLPFTRADADPEKYIRDRYWENEWK